MINYQTLFKSTYLRELCKIYNLTPSKKYGQNYLISKSPIDKMIEVGDLQKTDTVVEIGPGFGVLTCALADRVQKVFSFEIEQKLRAYWEENTPENVEIIWGNALTQLTVFGERNSPPRPSLTEERGDRRRFPPLFRKLRCERSAEQRGAGGELRSPGAGGAMPAGRQELRGHPYKVLANLPYQITSNLLRVLLEATHKPERIVVMVQKEVGERITAKKGDMSLLAVSVQYYGVPKMIAKVSAGNFWPVPQVDSAIISIEKIGEKKYGVDDARFFEIVSAGFAHKRKQLWRNLSEGLKVDREVVKNVLQEVVGNELVRSQELGVEEWVRVITLIDRASARVKKL